MWNKVVREVVSNLWHLSSHSAALGIGKLFSLIPSKSSKVLPIPPTLPCLACVVYDLGYEISKRI